MTCVLRISEACPLLNGCRRKVKGREEGTVPSVLQVLMCSQLIFFMIIHNSSHTPPLTHSSLHTHLFSHTYDTPFTPPTHLPYPSSHTVVSHTSFHRLLTHLLIHFLLHTFSHIFLPTHPSHSAYVTFLLIVHLSVRPSSLWLSQLPLSSHVSGHHLILPTILLQPVIHPSNLPYSPSPGHSSSSPGQPC